MNKLGLHLLACLIATALASGCSSSNEPSAKAPPAGTDQVAKSDSPPAGATESKSDAPEPPPEATKPFKLGDLLEAFTPPTLEEIDKSAEWSDQPVLSGMEILRKKQEAKGPPPVSVKDALALRNDSPENNTKILDTLGRLAPSDGAGVDFESSFVRHTVGDMKSSNPLFISTVTEFEYNSLTSFQLIAYDQELNYFAPAEYVVSWQTSKDHMMDKFVLRDDITWSDGKLLTAKDLEFSFQAIMSEAVPILAVRTGTDQLKSVHAYDDHTLVVFHKEPLATNTTNMAYPVVPQHVYERSIADDPTMARSEYHTNLEDHPVVCGPYELASRVRNQEFVVKRREGFYMVGGKQVRAKPYFREVRVKIIEDANTALLALKAGQIDEMELRAEHWQTQTNGDDFYAKNTKVSAVEWSEFHFVWNSLTPYFSDKRVRTAMSYAFDYDEFLNNICYGLYQPCQGPYHPTSWAFPKNGPKPYTQDYNKAEDLLDAAGWTDSDGDGIRDKEVNGNRIPFEFTLLTYNTESGIQCATLMKECLEKIGIVCNVKPTEFTVLTDSEQKKKFDAAMGGWQSSTDPDSGWNLYRTGQARNYGSYSNKRVDELYEKGRREFDRDKRAAIYGEIHNIMWEDQPYTWLFYRNAFYAFNKKARGYNFCPTGPFSFTPGFDCIFDVAAGP